MLVKHMLKTGVLLGLFAIVGTALIAFTFDNTAERIAAEEREFLLRSIQALIPASAYDNDLYSDTVSVVSPALLGSHAPIPVYRARKDGKPVALVMEPVAPDGYSGLDGFRFTVADGCTTTTPLPFALQVGAVSCDAGADAPPLRDATVDRHTVVDPAVQAADSSE